MPTMVPAAGIEPATSLNRTWPALSASCLGRRSQLPLCYYWLIWRIVQDLNLRSVSTVPVSNRLPSASRTTILCYVLWWRPFHAAVTPFPSSPRSDCYPCATSGCRALVTTTERALVICSGWLVAHAGLTSGPFQPGQCSYLLCTVGALRHLRGSDPLIFATH